MSNAFANEHYTGNYSWGPMEEWEFESTPMQDVTVPLVMDETVPESLMPTDPPAVRHPEIEGKPEQDATSSPELPDGHFNLGGDLLVGVPEYAGQLHVEICQYVIKNNAYVPTIVGITMPAHSWERTLEKLQCFNLDSVDGYMMIDRQLFLTMRNSNIVFQIVYRNWNGGLQLDSLCLSLNRSQFQELCSLGEIISRLVQERLLGSLFLSAVRDLLIVVSDEDVYNDKDEMEIHHILKNNLVDVLKKHIRAEFNRTIDCEGCSGEEEPNNQLEHTCFEMRIRNWNRCIASLNVKSVVRDFVYFDTALYPYISESFIQSLNAPALFEMLKLSVCKGL